MGFRLDPKTGADQYDKKYYGVPVERGFDYMNDNKLVKGKRVIPGNLFKDGFTRVERSFEAIQNQTNDSGKVKPAHITKTASGYYKKRAKK